MGDQDVESGDRRCEFEGHRTPIGYNYGQEMFVGRKSLAVQLHPYITSLQHSLSWSVVISARLVGISCSIPSPPTSTR